MQPSNPPSQKSLKSLLERATALKPFPAVASKLLAQLEDPTVSLRQVRMLLERDTSMTSGVLRVANSTVYRAASPSQDVDAALVRLGARNVSEIVAGIAALGMFTDLSGVGREVRDHCASTAAICRVLGAAARGTPDMFLAGLVHDVGKLMFMQLAAIHYESHQAEIRTPERTHLYEKGVLGFDHAEFGALVLEQWRFAPAVVKIVAEHHGPRSHLPPSVVSAIALLRIAEYVDHNLRRQKKEFDDQAARFLADDLRQCQLSDSTVRALWPRMLEAVTDMLSTFGR
jgi:putative nucleotidyltransferase with HDIG domain